MNSGKNIIINEGTKIKTLLDIRQKEVIEALVELNHNFKKLQNPILRKLLAGRVTIGDACRVARCPLPDFLSKMRSIGFETDAPGAPDGGQEESGCLALTGGEDYVDFDARPVLAANADPLKAIMQLARSLKDGQCLRVTAPFVPVPLITLLAGKGFSHTTEAIGPDHFNTIFKKGGDVELPAVESEPIEETHEFDELLSSIAPEKIRYIDVRELEMPQPMLTIMENLESLPDDGALFVYHKKVPVYFLPQLHDKGYTYLLKKTDDEKVNMLIYRS